MAFVRNNSSIHYDTFASEALSGLSPFQLVFLRDPPNLTSLSFPKIDTIPVKHREYYNLLLARAQLVGNMLLEWQTKQALEYENNVKKFRNEEIFQDNPISTGTACFSIANEYHDIQTRFYRPIIHR